MLDDGLTDSWSRIAGDAKLHPSVSQLFIQSPTKVATEEIRMMKKKEGKQQENEINKRWSTRAAV